MNLSMKQRWRRKWQPIPVLLPGKFHGWRRLVGYSLWGRKESDTTERLTHTQHETETNPGASGCHGDCHVGVPRLG